MTDEVRPLVAVLDYGIGNLRSAQKALERVGADARLTADSGLIADADAVVREDVDLKRCSKVNVCEETTAAYNKHSNRTEGT